MLQHLAPRLKVLLKELAVVLPLFNHIVKHTVPDLGRLENLDLAEGDVAETIVTAAEHVVAASCQVESSNVGSGVGAKGVDARFEGLDALFEFGVLRCTAFLWNEGRVWCERSTVARGEKADMVVVNPEET